MKKGSQKSARFKSLEKEIIHYVGTHPGKSANGIAAHLISKGLGRNINISSKKIGFHIRRRMQDTIVGIKIKKSNEEAKRIYYLIGHPNRPLTEEEMKEHTLEFLANQEKPCKSADIAVYLSEVSGYQYNGGNIYNQLLEYPEVSVDKKGIHNVYFLKEKLYSLEDKIK